MPEIPLRTAMLDAIVAALEAAAITIRTTPLIVERARTDAAERDERPLIVVVSGDMEPVSSDTLAQRYRLSVMIAGYVAGADEAESERDAAELHAKVVRALVRPNPAGLPVSLLLADGVTEMWVEDGRLAVDLATVAESADPNADFVLDIFATADGAWGNLFLTV
jgi:hypothetical protein